MPYLIQYGCHSPQEVGGKMAVLVFIVALLTWYAIREMASGSFKPKVLLGRDSTRSVASP